MSLIAVIVIVVIGLFFVYASIRVLREYERGVVFTLGRYTGTKGPGLFLLVPFVQQMVRVDLRVVVDEVPPQDVISRDNVSVKVSAVIYFRVVDAERAIIQVSNYLAATSQLAQTTLRWVLGKHDLDQMLAERDKLNADIQDVLDKQTEGWGIKVSNVELKRIDLEPSMIRTIARQAEAERERRAKIINAEGEQQAAQKLVDAARILADVPQAMQLRYRHALRHCRRTLIPHRISIPDRADAGFFRYGAAGLTIRLRADVTTVVPWRRRPSLPARVNHAEARFRPAHRPLHGHYLGYLVETEEIL